MALVRKRAIPIFIFFYFVHFYFLSYADILYLNNGRSMEGIIKNEDENEIELEVSAGRVRIEKKEISRIERASQEDTLLMRQRWEKEKIETDKRIAEQRLQEERRPKGVAFSHDGQSVIISAKLNNKVEANLILDTGATLVMLRRAIAEKLGFDLDRALPDIQLTLADGRKVNGKYVILESIKVQNVEARNVEAGIILDEAGALGSGDGLLGMSFLKKFNFKVDHKEKRLILEKL
ncbi:MAG: retropepsin-like aspartic protease [Candidatus Omnitrophota bacterium]